MVTAKQTKRTGLEIAVIGMSGKFPGAQNIEEFWQNLVDGLETIRQFTDEELENAGINPEELKLENYVKAKGIIDDIENFDASFFKFSPLEATVLDPQIRVFLEISWEALENAGYIPETYKGKIGVYAGASPNLLWHGLANYSPESYEASYLPTTLFNKDYLGMTVSYKLDLKGPSFSMFTACSTSLVAVDLACRALLTGECEMALAGGVSANLPVKTGYLYQEGMLVSKDGHCRAFDAEASGTVFGQGAGVVLLKPLERAINDRDHMYAVIKSSFCNNDGVSKVGFTAPSARGQAVSIRAALYLAEVEPETIGLVEAHGTGTIMGDPIEFEALATAFQTDKKGFCWLGSVKANVGHLDCAAGITGFIKAVLTIKHQAIPPICNFGEPNPKIDLENSPFKINTEVVEWHDDKRPLRAAVNSLGIGGTNAHVILEEPPVIDPSSEGRRLKLMLFSARTESALHTMTGKYVEFFQKNPDTNLADTAYTLQVGRKNFRYRKMIVCEDVGELIDELQSTASKKVQTFLNKSDNQSAVFMFTGQGAQYVNMGLGLYKTESTFRQELDRCFEILQPIMGLDVKKIVFPDENESQDSDDKEFKQQINQTAITQPVLFAFEYALARLLMTWGIIPRAMIGHSIGEYVAACLAGVFSLEDALKLVVLRSRLMQGLPAGSMLSVSLPESELLPLMNEKISLAAINGNSQCTVSGTHEAIGAFAGFLKEKGHDSRRLHTSHAFHSYMMDPILKDFEDEVSRLVLKEPQLPYISNISGTWVTMEEATDPAYWSRHIRSAVRFADGLTELLEEEGGIFIEVGPGHVLSTLLKQHMPKNSENRSINLVRHPKENVEDDYFLLNKLGRLWLFGLTIDWEAFYARERRSRLPLPTYPFEKKRLWLKGSLFNLVHQTLSEFTPGKNKNIGEWFYVPVWKQSLLPLLPDSFEFQIYLLFIDASGLGRKFVDRLEDDGHDVTIVNRGAGFSRENNREYTINADKIEDYDRLFNDLRGQGRLPQIIVHMWGVTGKKEVPRSILNRVNLIEEVGFFSLVYMMQSFGKKNYKDELKLYIVSNNMHDVAGGSEISPEKAMLLGPTRVIPKEYPNTTCYSIDILLPEAGSRDETLLIEQLYAEVSNDITDEVIAYRDRIRWTLDYQPVRWDKTLAQSRLREGGVYLITGGLGGIGLVLAKHLASNGGTRLILTGRSSLPDRKSWQQWLDTHDEDDFTSDKIRKIQELEQMGAEVMAAGADVGDRKMMQKVIEQAVERFGPINGVIHAAGLIDYGGMIQRRIPEATLPVLDSKIKGALVLDSLITNEHLDFFILCSSVSSVLGPFGEVGYCAANTFLDAFARYKYKRDGVYSVAIGWDGWQEVGMMVKAVKQRKPSGSDKSQPVKLDHPLIDECTIDPMGHKSYDVNLSVKDYWVLSGHRIRENAVMVGTAYLEMARGAFENHAGIGSAQIENFYFLNPLVVGDEINMAFRLVLKKWGDRSEFFFMGRPDSGDDKWKAHARGEVVPIGDKTPRKFNVEEIKAKCNMQNSVISKEDFKTSQGHMTFDHRWNCLREIYEGDHEALARLELLDEFKGEIGQFAIHPALQDVATYFVLRFVPWWADQYLPFYYKKIRVYGALTPTVYSYGRWTDNDSSSDGMHSFDITIMDDQGNELMDIEEYTFLAVSAVGATKAAEVKEIFSLSTFLSSLSSEDFQDDSNESLGLGILPEEGIDVFSRVLSENIPQVVISTQNLVRRLERIRHPALPASSETAKDEDQSDEEALRAELTTEYVAPRNGTEEQLATIIGGYLGLTKIGVLDDFFELGLDSLKALSLLDRINNEFELEIALAEVYNFPSIEGIANYIENKSEAGEAVESEASVSEAVVSN